MWCIVETASASGIERQSLAGGRSNYDAKCAGCHGARGKGDGWRATLFRLTLRDLSNAAVTQTQSDEYLFQIVKQGGANLGKPGMPSFGLELTDREVKDLVTYIRSFSKAPESPKPAGAAR